MTHQITTVAIHFITRIFHFDRYLNVELMQIDPARDRTLKISCIMTMMIFDAYIIYIYLNFVTLIDLSVLLWNDFGRTVEVLIFLSNISRRADMAPSICRIAINRQL